MKTKYYSPQLDRQLVSALYHEAKARRIAMTTLANDLIRSAFKRSKTESCARENGKRIPSGH
jgi:post-segregation antitoxin (ccd killing protein)